MAKVIEFDLSTDGIDSAIAQVKAYQVWIATKKQELIERLAVIGASVARVEFTGAMYAGKNDVAVEVTFNGNEATIIASGEAVAFIEFGSGVAYGGGYLGMKPAGVSELGTYGKGKGATGKSWIYKGEAGTSGKPVKNKKGEIVEGIYRTKGNPPAMAMYKATREMEQKFTAIVREVFK